MEIPLALGSGRKSFWKNREQCSGLPLVGASYGEIDPANAVPLAGVKVEDAQDGDFPFAVSLSSMTIGPFCTGVLITDRHVLTTAHCLSCKEIVDVRVAIGKANRESSTKFPVESWVTYNEWTDALCIEKEFADNDIAIVKLAQPTSAQPVKLSRAKNSESYGMRAMTMGWGRMSDGTLPVNLKKAEVNVMSNGKCSQHVAFIVNQPKFEMHSRFLCTSAKPIVLLTCGDSGGPLLDENKVLLGINKGTCPGIEFNTLPEDTFKKLAINGHIGVDYYRHFIKAVAGV